MPNESMFSEQFIKEHLLKHKLPPNVQPGFERAYHKGVEIGVSNNLLPKLPSSGDWTVIDVYGLIGEQNPTKVNSLRMSQVTETPKIFIKSDNLRINSVSKWDVQTSNINKEGQSFRKIQGVSRKTDENISFRDKQYFRTNVFDLIDATKEQEVSEIAFPKTIDDQLQQKMVSNQLKNLKSDRVNAKVKVTGFFAGNQRIDLDKEINRLLDINKNKEVTITDKKGNLHKVSFKDVVSKYAEEKGYHIDEKRVSKNNPLKSVDVELGELKKALNKEPFMVASSVVITPEIKFSGDDVPFFMQGKKINTWETNRTGSQIRAEIARKANETMQRVAQSKTFDEATGHYRKFFGHESITDPTTWMDRKLSQVIGQTVASNPDLVQQFQKKAVLNRNDPGKYINYKESGQTRLVNFEKNILDDQVIFDIEAYQNIEGNRYVSPYEISVLNSQKNILEQKFIKEGYTASGEIIENPNFAEANTTAARLRKGNSNYIAGESFNSFDEMAEWMNQQTKGKLVTGYNIRGYDIPVMKQHGLLKNRSQTTIAEVLLSGNQMKAGEKYLDLYDEAMKYMPLIEQLTGKRTKGYQLTDLADFFEVNTKGAHVAARDVELTETVLNKMISFIEPLSDQKVVEQVRRMELNNEKIININMANANKQPDIPRDNKGRPLPFNNSRGVPIETQGYHFRVDTNAGIPGINITTSNARLRKQFMEQNYELFSGNDINTQYGKIRMPEQRISSADQLKIKDNVLRIAAERGDVDFSVLFKNTIGKELKPETLNITKRILDISNKEMRIINLVKQRTDRDIFEHIYSNYLKGEISKKELIDSLNLKTLHFEELNTISKNKKIIQQDLIDIKKKRKGLNYKTTEIEEYIKKVNYNYKNASALRGVLDLSENESVVLSTKEKLYGFFEKTLKNKDLSVYEKISLLENKMDNEDDAYLKKIIANLKKYQDSAEEIPGLYSDDFLNERRTKRKNAIEKANKARKNIKQKLNILNINEVADDSINRILSESDYSVDILKEQNDVVWRELQNRYSRIGEEQYLYDEGYYAKNPEEQDILKQHAFEYEIEVEETKEYKQLDNDEIIEEKTRNMNKSDVDEFKQEEIPIKTKNKKSRNKISIEVYKKPYTHLNIKEKKEVEELLNTSKKESLEMTKSSDSYYDVPTEKGHDTDYLFDHFDTDKNDSVDKRTFVNNDQIRISKESDDIYGNLDYLEPELNETQENVRKTRRIKKTLSTDKLNIIDYMPKTWAKFSEFINEEIATDGRLVQMLDQKTIGSFGNDLSKIKREFLKNVITAYTIQQGGSQNIGINQDFDEMFANNEDVIELAKRVTKRQLQEDIKSGSKVSNEELFLDTNPYQHRKSRSELKAEIESLQKKTKTAETFNHAQLVRKYREEINLIEKELKNNHGTTRVGNNYIHKNPKRYLGFEDSEWFKNTELTDGEKTKLEHQIRGYVNNDSSRIKTLEDGLEIDGKNYSAKQVVSMYKSGEFDKSLTRIFKEEIVNSAIFNARSSVLRKAKEGVKNGTYKNVTEGLVNEAANYINDNTYDGKVSLKYAKGINTNNLFEGLSKEEAFSLLVSDISENVEPEDLKVDSLNKIPEGIDELELEDMGADGKTLDVSDHSNIPGEEQAASSYSEVKEYIDTIARKIMSDEDFTPSEIRTLTHLIGTGTKIGDYEVVDNGEVLRLLDRKTRTEKTMSFKTASGDVRGVLKGIDSGELLEQLSRAMEIQDIQVKDNNIIDLMQYLSGGDLENYEQAEIIKRMSAVRMALGNTNEEQVNHIEEMVRKAFGEEGQMTLNGDKSFQTTIDEIRKRFDFDNLSNQQRRFVDSLTKNQLKEFGITDVNPNYYHIQPTQSKDPFYHSKKAKAEGQGFKKVAKAFSDDFKWGSAMGVGLTAFGISMAMQGAMQFFINKNEAAEHQKMAMNPIEGSEVYSSYFNSPRLAAQGYLENGYDMDDSFAYFQMTSGRM